MPKSVVVPIVVNDRFLFEICLPSSKLKPVQIQYKQHFPNYLILLKDSRISTHSFPNNKLLTKSLTPPICFSTNRAPSQREKAAKHLEWKFHRKALPYFATKNHQQLIF